MLDYKTKSIVLFQGVFNAASLTKFKLAQRDNVFICEGRPSLEAGRKTASVFLKKSITPTVISDNMTGFLFFKGLVKKAVIACQYADAAGALCDTGALIVAVLAKKHQVPLELLVAEPRTRFLGNPEDLSFFEGERIAPKGTQGYLPLVEWIPAKYLSRIKV